MRPFVDVAGQMKIKVNDRSGGCIIEDFDNDGLSDIVTSAWDIGEDPMHFFKNNGDGSFTDVTIEAGLLKYVPSQMATWNNYDNDGWLDLFVCNYYFDGSLASYAAKDALNLSKDASGKPLHL